jgi:hypothetical protein
VVGTPVGYIDLDLDHGLYVVGLLFGEELGGYHDCFG